MEKHKNYLSSVADDNFALTSQISQIAAQTQTQSKEEVNAAIRQCLLKLYESITSMSQHRGHPRTPRTRVLDAWGTFFTPIKSLTTLPSGDFLSARMLLYFCRGLSNQSALDMKLAKSRPWKVDIPFNQMERQLDDNLLECLKRMWTESNNCQDFEWVFGEYQLGPWSHQDKSSEEAQRCYHIAQALSPNELSGTPGRHFIFSSGAECLEGWSEFRGSIPGDAYERMRSPVHIPEDDDNVLGEKWMYKQIGNDGPIRDRASFRLYDKDAWNSNETERPSFPFFPRSLQFILDARRISQPLLAMKRRILAEKVLYSARIPPEIRVAILSHLDPPVRHPYLSKVNIVEAYTPFPKRNPPRCTECSNDKAKESTCPTKRMYIWSLPLRTFLVFHRSKTNIAFLCNEGVNCKGHHDNNKWKITQESELNRHVERTVKDRCGQSTTLAEVGFAPATDFVLKSNQEDCQRRSRWFDGYGPLEDTSNELKMNGGFFGLTSMMVHNKILIGSWQGHMESGSSTTGVQWAVARCFADKECAERALMKMHSRCHQC